MQTIMVAVLSVLVSVTCSSDDWEPPKDPNPTTILQEVAQDTKSGDFKVALAKQVWYHENANKIDPAQTGVRLSFALNSWMNLGKVYPPALKKMREIREATEKRVREGDQFQVMFANFHDVVAFNRTLGEEERTAELFAWIYEDDAEEAKRLFSVAKSALVKCEEFELCGDCIDVEQDIVMIGKSYTMGLTMAAQFGDQHQDFVEKKFVNDAAILVGILVKNERKDDAENTADALSKLVDDESLSTKLEKALESAKKGDVPTPWPS